MRPYLAKCSGGGKRSSLWQDQNGHTQDLPALLSRASAWPCSQQSRKCRLLPSVTNRCRRREAIETSATHHARVSLSRKCCFLGQQNSRRGMTPSTCFSRLVFYFIMLSCLFPSGVGSSGRQSGGYAALLKHRPTSLGCWVRVTDML